MTLEELREVHEEQTKIPIKMNHFAQAKIVNGYNGDYIYANFYLNNKAILIETKYGKTSYNRTMGKLFETENEAYLAIKDVLDKKGLSSLILFSKEERGI